MNRLLQQDKLGLPIPKAYNPAYQVVPRLPTLFDVLPIHVPRNNVVLEFFQRLGFETMQYAPEPMNSVVYMDEMLRGVLDLSIMTLVVYVAFYATANASPAVRRAAAVVVSGMVLLWPIQAGRGETWLFNFFRPAIGFRSALLAWDIFQIRTVHEVQSWSFRLFVCHLWFFPVEEVQLREREQREGFKRCPRMQCLKQMAVGVVQGVFAVVLLLAVPPKEAKAQMRPLVYHIYTLVMCVEIFLLLSSGGLLLFNLVGLVTGIEQEVMFQNPFFTTRLRYFWSRWNRAIATVLHRVIFGGRNTYQTLEQRKEEEARKAHASQQADMSTSGVDARSGAAARRRAPPGSTDRSAELSKDAGAPVAQKRSSFVKKSCLAVLTFFVSGLFHEYLIFFATPHHFGYNTLFFVLNGLATVLSSGIERFAPRVHRTIPNWLRYIFMVSFALATGPLFFAPFVESNFFANFQETLFLALPSDMARPLPMFVYVLGK